MARYTSTEHVNLCKGWLEMMNCSKPSFCWSCLLHFSQLLCVDLLSASNMLGPTALRNQSKLVQVSLYARPMCFAFIFSSLGQGLYSSKQELAYACEAYACEQDSPFEHCWDVVKDAGL